MNKSYGLKVSFNDKVVTNAGIDKENYVVTGCVTFVHRNDGSEYYNFNVSGLDSDEDDHLGWYNTDVKLGDTIEIELIDSSFDPPIERHKSTTSPEEKLQYKLEEFHYLKEKLKDYING
ncbi:MULTISPECIES: hypothetical protein [Sphingobacterium]|uniref:hypothetical protein n=1 Tax=Sphingobacterium TaxID=28453 RepID=UPI0013D91A62|nr:MULTISPECIES: hypothetical protein [unclassified Sphingobacterium]